MFVLVVAKEPVPGRVKTRLCPPCTPAQAADIAEAALHDTFTAVMASGADRVIVALDGAPGPWLPAGVEIIPQIDATFDRRLAAAWSQTCGPGIQIGMDTPQVDAELLDRTMAALAADEVDAVLGPADDGGWWAIGMDASIHGADFADQVFHGVPMSRADTGRQQQRRLSSLGLRTEILPSLTDVDHFPEAVAVARSAPDGRFAAAVGAVRATDSEDSVLAGEKLSSPR